MRFGVVEREPPGLESSGGAEGERIAARECGEGMIAVWVLLRPWNDRYVTCWVDCWRCAERGFAHRRWSIWDAAAVGKEGGGGSVQGTLCG